MSDVAEVFPGSGEMARLMRAHDWDRSRLGDPSGWPRDLRTCVQVCLESRFPIVLWWGEDLRLLYNDAWRPALGALKHPAIDRPGREVWAEIWHIIGPQLTGVLETGEATWSTDMLLPMDRFGYLEETYWTYSYSPIRDDDGDVCGVFTPVAETTQRVLSARRLRVLQRLGEAGSARSVGEACALAIEAIGHDPADIPFARIHLAEDGVARETAATAGVPAEVPAGDVDLHARDGRWPWAPVRETGMPAIVTLDAAGGAEHGEWGPVRLASVHALSSPTEGDPVGYLVAGISPGRAYDDPYKDFVALVARHAATLIVNASALDDERRRARALAALQTLTAALSEALTPSAVAGALIDIGLPLLGGVAGALMVVDEDAGVLRSVRLGGYPAGSAEREWRISLAERTPLTDAVRYRTVRYADSSDEAVRRWPSMNAFRTAHGLDGSLATAPIVSGGRTLGALAVRYPGTGPLGDDARLLLETVARLTGPALLRSSHYILQHSVAETLQRSLLPLRLPAPRGLSIAAGYTAAGEGIEAGGDWYDAIELPGGRLALMVGDVVGRGPRPAAVMGQLRSALRAFAVAPRGGPGDVVANLSRFASTVDGADVATACYAELDLSAGRLRYVCAGHPPPLLLTADGATRYLQGGRGVPLGVRDTVAYAQGEERIPAGATVVLYTDGLVERRGENIDVGFGRLAVVVAHRRSEEPSAFTDGILADLGGSGDDCALLTCRIDPPERALEVQVGADARELRTARAELREWLAGLGVAPADVEDVVLASGEALANCVEHGHGSRGNGTTRLRAAVDATRSALDIEVMDDGRWRPPPREPGDRGRGFALMRALMEHVEIEHDDRGTRVGMRRRLHPGRIAPSPRPARPRGDDEPAPDRPDGTVLRLEGDIDASNAAALMRDLSGPDPRVRTVDLTAVITLGSAAIQLLFGAARRLRDRGETLEIIAAPGSLTGRLLELTDLGSLCSVRPPDSS